jgi:hypothetical protein
MTEFYGEAGKDPVTETAHRVSESILDIVRRRDFYGAKLAQETMEEYGI